jgi:hypothetical protein
MIFPLEWRITLALYPPYAPSLLRQGSGFALVATADEADAVGDPPPDVHRHRRRFFHSAL